jgi:molybdopterin synthase sulfur carrier subunit
MKVRVKYFSIHRDMTDKTEEEIQLDQGATLKDLLDRLIESYSRLKDAKDYTVISINGNFAEEKSKLKDGDVVALFPPVGGG